MKVISRAVTVVALCITAFAAPRALAQPNIMGRFNGFGESHALPAVQRGASLFEVTAQTRGRFRATLMVPIGIDPCWFSCDGSVMPSGIINGAGQEDDGDFILFTGRTRLMGDGSVRVASLLYGEFGPFGNLQDVGVLLYLQMQGGQSWNSLPAVQDVTGHWEGTYKPSVGPGGGRIEFDLLQFRGQDRLTSAFGGAIHMDQVFLPAVQKPVDLIFDALGTVGVPAVQRRTYFASLGSSPEPPVNLPRTVAILIGLLTLPDAVNGVPAVQGNYRLYNSMSDAFLDVVFELNTSFQGGLFNAPKTLPQ